MEELRAKKGFICDMDGVIYWGGRLLPGVKEFVDWLYRENKEFLFLTNNSGQTPLELRLKLKNMGLDVDESHFYTSALATAKFVSEQTHHLSLIHIFDTFIGIDISKSQFDNFISIHTKQLVLGLTAF